MANQNTPSAMQVYRYRNAAWQCIDDTVTMETKFSVSWQHDANASGTGNPGHGETTLWAWPHDLTPLALGHVLLDQVPAAQCLHRSASVAQTGDASFAVTIGDSLSGTPPVAPVVWQPEAILAAMHSFITAGGLWDATGCFHRAGVFSVTENTLLTRAEDIGRHNCVDRLAGWSVLHNTSLADKALLISARMTSSLCAKALRAGFRIIISRSAVTTAAIAMAEQAGATLVGFARTDEGRFTVFSDEPRRIPTPSGGSACAAPI